MSVDDLTGYLTNNSTAFQELGYDTTDALALLISLSDSGANVGSVMGGMTKAVTNLSGVTKDVPGTFQQAIQAIGDCDTVSEALQAQVGDTGKTVEDIFGKKAAQELAVNIQNGNFQIDKWTEALQNNEGALEGTTEGATTMQDSWSQATNNVSLALSQTFVPVISDVVKQVAEVVTKIAQVVQSSPELQAVIVGVAAGLGILATALAISSVISVVQKAFALLNTTMLANPIFLVVTALAALAAGLVYAYNNSETFRNIVNQAFEVMKSVVITVVTTVRDTVVTVFEAIKSAISTAVSTASTVVSNVFNTMKSTVTTIVNAISAAASTAFNAMKTAVTTAVNATKTAVTTVWNGIKSTVSTVVNAVRTTVTTVWNGIRSVTSSVWNGIKTAVTTPINAAKSAVSTTVNGIRSTMTSVFGGIRSTVSSIFSGIQSAITSPIQTAKNTLANLVSGIKGLFSGLHISLPHINLPHFRISGGTPPYGIAGKGTAPSIGIDWYAQGAVLKKATSFGINTATGNRMVGGEAGYEAVAPIDVLQGYVQAAVESVVGNSALDYDLLADKIANACARTNTTLEPDGRQLGRVVGVCMMQLYYEAADGTILNLMQNGIYAQDPEALTQNTWSYTTISGVNGLARVKRFYKNVQTAKMKLSIMAADKEEFNTIMYEMHRIFEKDVRNMTPGKIWWNNFYKEGFVYSTSNDDYEELFESVEHEIEFLSVNPSWIRRTTYQYRAQANETGTLDYPRDYGYDYDRADILEFWRISASEKRTSS